MKRALTSNQQTLWIGQKMHPDVPIHNTAYAFTIAAELDLKAFRKAFQKLVYEVEAFRTVFKEEDGVPMQSVKSDMSYEMECIDLSLETDQAVQLWLEKRSQRLLELDNSAFDSALIRRGERKFIWFLNMHHLITDAVSLATIFQNTADYYKAYLNRTELPKDINPAPYSEYIDDLVSQKNGKRENNNTGLLSEKLEGLGQLPRYYGVKKEGSATRASRISIPLSKEKSDKIRALITDPDLRSWSEHLSLFNFFTSLFFVFLYRTSGKQQIAIGAPSHNRGTRKFARTVGYFVQVFPLINELQASDTFRTLIKRNALEINDYLRYSTQGESNYKLNQSFNAVLNYINTEFGDFCDFETKTSWIHPGHMDEQHQIRCHVMDFQSSGAFEIAIDLNDEVFSKDLREKVSVHFTKLLDAFITDLDTPILKPELITADEKSVLIPKPEKGWKFVPTIERFHQTARKFPESTALRLGSETIDYRDLERKVGALALKLKEQGVKPGDAIGVCFFRSPEYIISILAVMKLGAVFVPIASDLPEHRVKYMVETADCVLLLTNELLARKLSIISKPTIEIDHGSLEISEEDLAAETYFSPKEEDPAYIIFTSGSTGDPKGTVIPNLALSNYSGWAASYYLEDRPSSFPLFTSVGFDLTITSTFLPLLTGGEIVIYKENERGPDMSILQVIEDNIVEAIKLTPSHLNLISGIELVESKIRTVIIGGEDLRTDVALKIHEELDGKATVYNEYGPTEATVGCVVSRFDPKKHNRTSVPIGQPIRNMQVFILDPYGNLNPAGVAGELFLGGHGIAKGYLNNSKLNQEKFAVREGISENRLYQTGDLARWNSDGELEFLGRIDEQVKLKGYRIELTDIEANLNEHEAVNSAAVVLLDPSSRNTEDKVLNCAECGLPSNYPNADFDDEGVCHLCNSFKGYRHEAAKYFKTEEDLKQLLSAPKAKGVDYDCLTLLSGGKDSTYILARLVNMGLKVLAFTLDNGYISDQAKNNINKIVKKLGVDHIYGETPHMNKVFVDSLHRHANVCNGCFKVIYTLSTQIALERNIPFVVTGLSRGQFFETRLTEELFWESSRDTATIDETILEARKLYHQEEDAVKNLMDVSMFQDPATFEKVQFVDFYRYSDVSLTEMLHFLKEKVGWERPTDTGRSTNCLINQVGIYVHKKEKGYSNYSFPYSWDVRLGHKTRAETLEEINEYIDEKEVKRIMKEIGYLDSPYAAEERRKLVGYYTSDDKVTDRELYTFLRGRLPSYMVPSVYKRLESLPLTSNGKVDRLALQSFNEAQLEMETAYVAPRNEIEELLEGIWKEVLQLKKIGVHDNFITLGGHSLAAIRVTTRINEELGMGLGLNKIFELPTIAEYAAFIEATIVELLE
ncbi:non-ribosomal peptide synthetase [Poritiphilus flavus]|uniref:Amino acid adenylation domain-containing protein n=1 Tax=Poritiphilus flavus TaxID=2697053 RepID=A0A6L9EFF5_9FLAO|nr:non-ribosomal peptide synthetase [Poritiphilus flavus]NAS13238.1 amino acid adenylation domain-containing protein [Poritiphilus flavus]